jgi:ubiquinone/menaquinone biosynthesis C-methylase UbiE
MDAKQRSVDYSTIASVYDRRYQENDYSGIERTLLQFVSGAQSGTILEAGCGTGFWLAQLARQGYRVTGLDKSLAMLCQVQEQLLQGRLLLGNAEALPFRQKVFDRVFCINAFHHFSDKKVFVHEAHRVLKKRGGILISGLDPHNGNDRWWIYDYFPQVIEIEKQRYPAAGKMQEMLSQAGFINCDTLETLHIPVIAPARSALESGRLAKTSTSQLAILTDAEYQRGMNRLRQDIEEAESRGQILEIEADLRVYATTAWIA